MSLDLKSAQLAVASKTWNIPALHEFLAKKHDVWEYFWNQCDCPPNYKDFKAVVKKHVYSIVFGMTLQNLTHGERNRKGKVVEPGLVDTLQPYGVTPEQFLAIPFVQELLAARTRVYAEINTNGGAYDAFGRWIAVTKEIKNKSVAAQVAQSYELKLLYPVVRAAKITNEFHIRYWLHDGLYLSIRQADRIDWWINRVTSAVDEIAVQLDIPTRLVNE